MFFRLLLVTKHQSYPTIQLIEFITIDSFDPFIVQFLLQIYFYAEGFLLLSSPNKAVKQIKEKQDAK